MQEKLVLKGFSRALSGKRGLSLECEFIQSLKQNTAGPLPDFLHLALMKDQSISTLALAQPFRISSSLQ